MKKVRWFLTKKIDFESLILALFDHIDFWKIVKSFGSPRSEQKKSDIKKHWTNLQFV